jgi:hypothetical protein
MARSSRYSTRSSTAWPRTVVPDDLVVLVLAVYVGVEQLAAGFRADPVESPSWEPSTRPRPQPLYLRVGLRRRPWSTAEPQLHPRRVAEHPR